ncbi:hypothetical protein [Microcoleus sp. herbarium14]|uniref:hypothetical protein n=1 Tax=Microcoleus sp. herbarium14 TaxID=3055439 RepID=UPI002FCEE908
MQHCLGLVCRVGAGLGDSRRSKAQIVGKTRKASGCVRMLIFGDRNLPFPTFTFPTYFYRQD